MAALAGQRLREAQRWYPLKDIPIQLALIASQTRFNIAPAGRRSGKTERFKRKVVKAAMMLPGTNYFACAPTRDQAKRIFWNDLKLLSLSSTHSKPPSETELIIHFDNGSTIHVIGLDKPARIEGVPWDGGGCDEFGDTKPEAWPEHILPALDTMNPQRPDYKPWCWIFGVPEGLNHYYDLAQYAESANDPDWGYFHWKSSLVLPPEIIEARKRQMSPRQFKQEYEASFETVSGRIYEDYDANNKTNQTIADHEQLLWFHDFNYTPLSSGVGVVRKNDKGKETLLIGDEIVLESAISRQSATEFCERFKDHKNKKVKIYGDPAGRAGEKHGHESDYTNIEDELRRHGWRYERLVTPAAPAIKDRQNSVRAMVANAAGERRLFVNPSKCRYADKGLSTVQVKKGSTFLEADSDFQHITTAIGYMVHYRWPVTAAIPDDNPYAMRFPI